MMSGLLLATFVVALSGTIVSNALPRIIDDLDGSQSQYTWLATSVLLTLTAAGPIWSKLADRMDKKLLLQASLAIVVVGSVLCGAAPSTEVLLVLRAIEGIGMGGLGALIQVALAALISPRERGRYVGYITAIAAAATVCGPFLGGLIVDAPLLGWRWCFWLPAPIAVGAMLVLHRTLHLPKSAGRAKIDWIGAFVIPAAICVFLAWVTLADRHFNWLSWPSATFLAATGLLIAVAVVAERRVTDPFLPPAVLRRRTMVLSLTASIVVGGVMMAAAVYFAQYFQISRDQTPTESGLLQLPMVAGVLSGTMISGHLVSRRGRYKRYLLTGTVLIAVGFALLGTIDRTTPLELVALYMTILGMGIGASLQNLVIAAQNELAYDELGAGTSVVLSFQTLGGAIGVAVLGSVLAAHVADQVGDAQADQLGSVLVQDAYGDATAVMFRVAAVSALLAIGAVVLLRESPLRTTVNSPPDLNREAPP